MKTKLKSILKFFGQSYADFLIKRLEVCNDLFEYEILMSQAVLLDFYFVEKFNIYLD